MSDPQLPPQNEEAETSALGAILLSERALDSLAVDVGLRPEHFYRHRHRLIYAAMLRLRDRGLPVDALTVCDELGEKGELEEAGGPAYAHSLSNLVPSAGNFRRYAEIVYRHAKMRRKLDAARDIQAAIHDGDEDAIRRAEEALLTLEQNRGGVVNPDELGRRLRARVEQGNSGWPLPFKMLTQRLSGGFKPGNVTLFGAWTSHGKTAWLAQCKRHIAPYAAQRLTLTTDTTPEEFTARHVASVTGIPLSRIEQGAVKEIEREAFDEAILSIPYPVVEAYGWSAQEITFDIRRAKPDVASVDMLHGIHYEDERDLRRISQSFNNLARETGTHVICTVHLNDARNLKDSEPLPVRRDIKGSTALAQDANNIVFVWRENDKGSISSKGRIHVSKARGGVAGGGVGVEFDGPTLTFKEPS